MVWSAKDTGNDQQTIRGGHYPDHPLERESLSGTKAINEGASIAEGTSLLQKPSKRTSQGNEQKKANAPDGTFAWSCNSKEANAAECHS